GPPARLAPIASRRLDDLILELRASLRATMVVVTHELPSIFAIADTAVFLDADTRTMIALGNPKKLRDESPEPKVRAFLTRGEQSAGGNRWALARTRRSSAPSSWVPSLCCSPLSCSGVAPVSSERSSTTCCSSTRAWSV